MLFKLLLNFFTLFICFFNLINTFLLKNYPQQNDLHPSNVSKLDNKRSNDQSNDSSYDRSTDEDSIDSDLIANNITMIINQLTKELALKVKDPELVNILNADKGKFKNLHKIKSESSAFKWIKQNRFLMKRINQLVANITEEFVVHDLLANQTSIKVDKKSADLLINRISQNLTLNRNNFVDKRMQKSIEIGQGFLEGVAALTFGKIIGFKLKSLLEHFLKKEKCKPRVKVVIVTLPTTTTLATTTTTTTTTLSTTTVEEDTEEPEEEMPDIPDDVPEDIPDYPEEMPVPEIPVYPPSYYEYEYNPSYDYDYYPFYYDDMIPILDYYYPYYYSPPIYNYYNYPYYEYGYYEYLPFFPIYYDYYGFPPPPPIYPPIITQPQFGCCPQQAPIVPPVQPCCNQNNNQPIPIPIPIPIPEPIIIPEYRDVPMPFPVYEPFFIPEPFPVEHPVIIPIPECKDKKRCKHHHYNSGSGGRFSDLSDDEDDEPRLLFEPSLISPLKEEKRTPNDAGFEFSNVSHIPNLLPNNILPPNQIMHHHPMPDAINHHLHPNNFMPNNQFPLHLFKREINETFIANSSANIDGFDHYAQQRRRRGRRGRRPRRRGSRRGGRRG